MADGERWFLVGPHKRWFSHVRTVAGALLVLAMGCGQPAASNSPNGGAATASADAQSWDQLVEAARREGTVALLGPSGAESRAALADSFERAYPGVSVQGIYGPSNVVVSRILAERTSGRYLADVIVNGTGSLVTLLKDAGVAAPLRSSLIQPEVVDESLWLNKRLWWADTAEPYTTLMFQGQVSTIAFYNKNMVDPSQFTSYWDFLDPKWKGKIVATDVSGPGPGAANARWMYKNSKLGAPYLERLFSEMDVKLSVDQRQLVDWVATGQYPLGLLISTTEVGAAEQQGLPVGSIPGRQFAEGVAITGGTGAVILVDQAPHPNAAKLYVNWLLSRDGQNAWQREAKQPSLRTDLPKADTFVEVPEPGIDYVNANSEEYARLSGTVMEELVSNALKKAGQR